MCCKFFLVKRLAQVGFLFPNIIGSFHKQRRGRSAARVSDTGDSKNLPLRPETQPKASLLCTQHCYALLLKLNAPVTGPYSHVAEQILLFILTQGRNCSAGICSQLSHSLFPPGNMEFTTGSSKKLQAVNFLLLMGHEPKINRSFIPLSDCRVLWMMSNKSLEQQNTLSHIKTYSERNNTLCLIKTTSDC